MTLRECIRSPIPEIEQAAQRLQDAVKCHIAGDREAAAALFRLTDDPIVRAWTDWFWGKGSSANVQVLAQPGRETPKAERYVPRMPSRATERLVHARDGYYCRFCGNPVVRADVRRAIQREYPDVVRWEPNDTYTQHAGLQCLWAQYDHLFPHQRGGTSELDNIVLTCAGCNYGKAHYNIDELGLLNPLARPAKVGPWDGLEQFLRAQIQNPEPTITAVIDADILDRRQATLRSVVGLLHNSRRYVEGALVVMAQHEAEYGPVILRIGVSAGSKFKYPSYRIDDAETEMIVGVYNGGSHKPWTGLGARADGQWSLDAMTFAEVEQLLAYLVERNR